MMKISLKNPPKGKNGLKKGGESQKPARKCRHTPQNWHFGEKLDLGGGVRNGGVWPKRPGFFSPARNFLIGAPKSPCFSGFPRITSFSVHPKKPILGGVVWLYCTILRIFMEIDLHFAARRVDLGPRAAVLNHTDTTSSATHTQLRVRHTHRHISEATEVK